MSTGLSRGRSLVTQTQTKFYQKSTVSMPCYHRRLADLERQKRNTQTVVSRTNNVHVPQLVTKRLNGTAFDLVLVYELTLVPVCRRTACSSVSLPRLAANPIYIPLGAKRCRKLKRKERDRNLDKHTSVTTTAVRKQAY